MSDKEKEMEKQMRLLKNRQSAKECRLRKKDFIHGLQERIAQLETREAKHQAKLATLDAMNRSLIAELQALRKKRK